MPSSFPHSLSQLRNTETIVPPPDPSIIQTLVNALPPLSHPDIIHRSISHQPKSKCKYLDQGASLIILTTINRNQISVLKNFFHSIRVPCPGQQPHQPQGHYPRSKPSLRILTGLHHSPNPSSNPAVPTTSSRVSGVGKQPYNLAIALTGAHNRIAFYGNVLNSLPAIRMGGLSRYKQVILVAVQSFVQLPLEFGRPSRERGWDGKSDGEYHRYEDETGEGTGAGTEREMKKKPVDYSVIMMYNVTRRERKVVVTRGVTVNEGWVRQVMWMCGFEDEDAEPGIVEGDGNDKGTKVKGRKPVGEEMKTTVWNGTTEHLDAGDWQEVAAGVSRYELIKEALEELRGDVEGWLS